MAEMISANEVKCGEYLLRVGRICAAQELINSIYDTNCGAFCKLKLKSAVNDVNWIVADQADIIPYLFPSHCKSIQ